MLIFLLPRGTAPLHPLQGGVAAAAEAVEAAAVVSVAVRTRCRWAATGGTKTTTVRGNATARGHETATATAGTRGETGIETGTVTVTVAETVTVTATVTATATATATAATGDEQVAAIRIATLRCSGMSVARRASQKLVVFLSVWCTLAGHFTAVSCPFFPPFGAKLPFKSNKRGKAARPNV